MNSTERLGCQTLMVWDSHTANIEDEARMRGKLEAPMQNDKMCMGGGMCLCLYMQECVSVNAGLCMGRYVCVSFGFISMDYE